MKNFRQQDMSRSITGEREQKAYTYVPIGYSHSFYLVGTIQQASEYTDWFHVIRTASPEDTVNIHINSGGGDLFTAIQFYRVLQETPANIVVHVEGECASAATIPLMMSDSIEIADHSSFMFHNYSGGAIGKGGELYDQVSHDRMWSTNLLTSLYKDFLTEKEIKEILDNKDIYMDADEVIKRLKARVKKLTAVLDEEVPEEVPEIAVPNPEDLFTEAWNRKHGEDIMDILKD